MRIGRVSPLQVFKFTHIWGHFHQDMYDILVKNNIYLIKQIVELTEAPEGIDSAVWKKIREDAKRIMENYDL